MTDSNFEERARKERSPSFPFISLRKALDRAEAMFAAHRRNPARISVVGETWSFSPSSSGLVQTVAALKAYGLLDDVGRGEDRRLQISELAIRILSDSRPGAREVAIREAAKKPKLLAEYQLAWLPDRPSDAHCISELTLDRGFTPDAATLFIRIFDDNASFAGLKGQDKDTHVGSLRPEGPSGDRESMGPTGPTAQQRDHLLSWRPEGAGPVALWPPVPIAAPPSATLPLPEGLVSLSLPSGLSERSVAALKSWLDVIVSIAAWQGEKSPPPPPEMKGG